MKCTHSTEQWHRDLLVFFYQQQNVRQVHERQVHDLPIFRRDAMGVSDLYVVAKYGYEKSIYY